MTGYGISEFFKIHKYDHQLQLLLGPFTQRYAEPIRELTKRIQLPMVTFLLRYVYYYSPFHCLHFKF